MKRFTSISIVMLLAMAGILATPPVAAGVWGPAPDVQFVDIDTLDETIIATSGLGALVGLQVLDVDKALFDFVEVHVESQVDQAGEFVTLYNIDDAGNFFGTIAFESVQVPENGLVYATDGKVVTATYTDKDGIDHTQTLTFLESHDGSVSLDSPEYFGEGTSTAVVTVGDADENTLDGTAETIASIQVRVYSDSDPVGFDLTKMEETGPATGVFKDFFLFTTGATVDPLPLFPGELMVTDGDTVTIEYTDLVDAAGVEQTRTTTATWHQSETGIVYFLDNEFRNPDAGSATIYSGTDKAYFRVVDRDQDTSDATDTVTVDVWSDAQVTPLPVTLTETGPHTGEFVGTVNLVNSPTAGSLFIDDPSPSDGTSETIYAQYDDDKDVTGDDPVPTMVVGDPEFATAAWNERTDASVRFTRCDGQTDAIDYFGDAAGGFAGPCADFIGYVAGDQPMPGTLLGQSYIRVEDEDRNQLPFVKESLSVTVRTPLDPFGTSVSLRETAADSGIYIGYVAFAPWTVGSMGVIDESEITVTYEDTDGAGAIIDRTDSATWHHALDGALTFEYALYQGTEHEATLTLLDLDANRDPDATETVQVIISSDSDMGGILVDLTEVSTNAPIFRATFGFTTGLSNDESDLIQVTDGDGVFAEYEDDRLADGSEGTIGTMTAWAEVDGTALLRVPTLAYYDTDSSSDVDVVLYDMSLNTNSALEETTTINVKVDWDSPGGAMESFTMDLTETDDDTGIFEGSFGFTTNDADDDDNGALCSDCHILVLEGGGPDAITISSTAPDVVLSWNEAMAPSEVAFHNVFSCDDAAAPDQQYFGTILRRCLAVDDDDANLDTDLIDLITVDVGDETFTLRETGVDTGRFTRVFLFEEDGAADNGFVDAASGGTLDMDYADDNPSEDYSDQVMWFTAGTLRFTDENYDDTISDFDGINTVHVEAFSPYQNEGLGSHLVADSFDVDIESEDGGDMITISMQETGPDTSLFRGDFDLEAAGGVSGSRLEVGGSGTDLDDMIYAMHTVASEHTGVPYPMLAWNKAGTASAFFIDEAAFLSLDANAGCPTPGNQMYAGLSDGFLAVCDPYGGSNLDPAVAETVVVTVHSTSDPNSIDVTLRETGGDTGVFTGVFGFTTDASSDPADLIEVSHEDDLSLSFDDSLRLDGTPGTLPNSNGGTWDETTTATLTTDMESYLEPASMTITVEDDDQNVASGVQDTVTVDVTSLKGDVETFTLTETGPNTGVFEVVVTFDSVGAVADDTDLEVDDEDTVDIVYLDTDQNGDLDAREADVEWFGSAGVGMNSGLVTLDKDDYFTNGDLGLITVIDPDLDTTFSADTVVVQVATTSDGAGAAVVLTETGPQTDIFTGSLLFEGIPTRDNQRVFAQDGDTVTVIYVDESGFSGDLRTDIDTATYHAAADMAPTATLTASPLGGAVPLSVTFTLGGADDGGIAGWELRVDGTLIAQGADDLSAATVDRDQVFTTEDTFNVELRVFDAGGKSGTDSVTITTVDEDLSAPDAITDLAVAGGSVTANSATLGWTQPDDNVGVSGYQVHISTTAITSGSFVAGTVPGGVTFVYDPATPGSAGDSQEIDIAGLSQGTQYFVALRPVDAAGNTAAAIDSATFTTTTDNTAPVGTLVISSPTHPENVATKDQSPTFTWTGLTDAESTIEYYYAFNQVSGHVIDTAVDSKTTSLTRGFQGIAAGTWHMHVQGVSAGGSSAQDTYTIVVEAEPTPTPTNTQTNTNTGTQTNTNTGTPGQPPTSTQIQNANKGSGVHADVTDGGVLVSWDDVPDWAEGAQVWRFGSWIKVADLPASSSGFKDKEFLDPNGQEGDVYLVTFYAGTTAGEGWYGPGTSPSTTTYPESSGSDGAEEDAGLPLWAWLVIFLGGLILLGLLIAIIVAASRSDDDEDDDWAPAATGAAWTAQEETWEQEPEEEEHEHGDSHHIMCPACSTRFTSVGQRPLVTHCPGCGKKGVLN